MGLRFNISSERLLIVFELASWGLSISEVSKNLCVSFTFQYSLDSSKLKGFADVNFEFDKNGRKFFKRVENTVRKGEIACHEQFLLFLQCFQKTCTADTYKPGFVWERVKIWDRLAQGLTLY